ncbi:TonB-dependent receptor [Flavobacterium sp.]|uniref:SusC/RagA family TonB-linked outer membrane protein n=1 Tax=Flavobacterium sp. TaxID=239 RepID=UPI00262D5607|nr:TonB-dependent receptor [Flavobacterium sp.]MDD3003306.1 TonB-dependent receptor [Flavobacterium sp.]
MLLLFWVASGAAQSVSVTGTVSNAQGVLPGVNVQVKNKSVGTTSDANGAFAINAVPEDTLVFSFIGYVTQEVLVGSQTKFTILLQADETALDEVLVNAGYYKVKDKERTGSIAKITAKDIELQPVTNPLAAIQGRMSGVNITQQTGTPGGGFSIQIRGLNSIRSGGNDPMYIIDDVPYPSQSLGSTDVSNGVMLNPTSPLNSLNPSDIESIEVLKDADATAIYGSRGANGVVLITTKRGKAGATKFDIHAYTSLGKVTRRLNVLGTDAYLAMRKEAFANDGYDVLPETAYDVNGTWGNGNTDWQKELLGGTAFVKNMQASISGGSDQTQFLLSGTYRKETTVFPGDANYKKGAIQSKVSHRSEDDKFKIDFSTDYVTDKNILPGADITRQAYMLAPNAPALYDANGNLNWENGTFENPLAALEGSYQTKAENLIANTLLSYKLYPGFELKASLGYNTMSLSESRTNPSSIYNPSYGLSSAYAESFANNAERHSWIIEPQLNFEQEWGRTRLEVLTGATFQAQSEKMLSIYAQGFPNDALINSLAAATNLTVLRNSINEYRYHALFGRINMVWDQKYIANITGRRDGSSRFGPGNRFANFGAIGTAWLFSKEPFLKKLEFVSFGKLRGSYGITGNDQIGDYQFLDTYETTSNIYDGVSGIRPARLFNSDFGWESNKKLEVALELGFFEDKLFFTAAWFQNRSSNQLVGLPLPGTSGFPSLQANLDAKVENRGLEFDIRTLNIQTKDFKWTSSLNITSLKNELLEFPNLSASTYGNTLVIGESLSIKKLYHYTGIDSETGTYTFEDFNGDGLITALDRYVVADTAPEYYGGFSNQLSYRNFELDFLFQFVKQKGIDVQASFPITGSLSNQPASVLEGSQIYTTGENVAAVTANANYSRSDATLTDASFIRLKNISLAYTIPTKWLRKASARFYIQGQNLLTFTKFKGIDPENQSFSSLPPLKQFTFGSQISF